MNPPERVDEAEHQDEHGDEPQIAVARDELEPAGPGHRPLDLRGGGHVRALASFAAMHPDGEPDGDQQAGCRQQHQPVRPDAAEHDRRDARADDGAERRADANQRKQALAALVGVQVVGKRPELRDRGHAEHANPQIEGDADPDAGVHEQREDQQVGGKEQQHPADQPGAIHPRGKRTVGGHEYQHQHGLPRRRVAGGDRAGLAQDQRIAHDLQHGIERQQVEHVGGEQERADAFAGMHLGEDGQGAIEQTLPGRGRHEFHGGHGVLELTRSFVGQRSKVKGQRLKSKVRGQEDMILPLTFAF